MTATPDAVVLQFDHPRLLAEVRAALATGEPVVVCLSGPAARRAATVFLGGDFRLYDGVRTVAAPGWLTAVLCLNRLADLAQVIAMGRSRGHRVDMEYVDAVREFRLELVPPPA
jgi:putative intracellular protease/amidase